MNPPRACEAARRMSVSDYGPKKTRRDTRRDGVKTTRNLGVQTNYFCHVRFLWRFDFKRFLRLCLFIFKRRFFFRLPIGE